MRLTERRGELRSFSPDCFLKSWIEFSGADLLADQDGDKRWDVQKINHVVEV